MKPVHAGIATLSLLALMGSTAARAAPPSPPAPGDAAAGAKVYLQTCAACHGDNGKGLVPGTPDFTQAGGVLSQTDTVLADRITHGYQSEGSPMVMPPKGGNDQLTATDIDNVIAYLRKTFGH